MSAQLHGLLAEFAREEALLAAARGLRDAGYRRTDAYVPHEVHGLGEALGLRPTRLPWIVAAGGVLGGGGAYAMQWYSAALDFPLRVAGRPYHSWPAFIPVTFELTVLGAAFAAFFATLIGNRATQLHHPLFAVDAFMRASCDRFFLCVESRDEHFDPDATRALLLGYEPLEVHDVPA